MRRQNAFTDDEYGRRLTVVRDEMAHRGIDCLAVTAPGNICYLTGYQTFGEAQQFLIVPSAGDVVFVLRELEAPLVAYTAWSGDVITYGDSDDAIEVVASSLAERVEAGVLGIDERTGTLSPALHRRLVELVGSMEVRDDEGCVESARVIKSEAEIAVCRQAARLTSLGMQAAMDEAGPGSTENHVAAAAAQAMTVAGSEWFANDPIVTSGHRSGIPHTTYARRALEPGDTVLVELGATFHRYFSPLMRSVTVGPASTEIRRMHEACQDALEAAMAVIRPGVASGEAHAACQQVIDDRGYRELFRKRLGYSVGIGFKTWSEGRFFDLKEGDQRLLRAGMVIHMPPAVRVPGVLGIGLSETIVVTDDGCEALADFPRHLFESR